jgi:hypothetical protein
MEQRLTPPRPDDTDRLAKQFLAVDQLAVAHLGRGLARDGSDLATLQALLDAGVPAPDQTYQLQCLGVVFGMMLVDALDGFDWVIVEDEYGRDPALRYLSTSLLLFPLTMISKRVEDGHRVDVAELFAQVCRRAVELRAEIGPA